MKRARLFLLCFVTLAITAGCGGGGGSSSGGGLPDDEPVGGSGGAASTTPVHQTGDQSVQAEIGSPGGSLALTNGARVEIPAGSLAEPVEVIFGVGSQTQAFNNRDYEKPVGPTLILQPALVAQPGTRFNISIPYTALPSGFTEDQVTIGMEVLDDDQRAEQMGSTQTIWVYQPANAQNGRLVAEMTETSGMRLQFLVSEE